MAWRANGDAPLAPAELRASTRSASIDSRQTCPMFKGARVMKSLYLLPLVLLLAGCESRGRPGRPLQLRQGRRLRRLQDVQVGGSEGRVETERPGRQADQRTPSTPSSRRRGSRNQMRTAPISTSGIRPASAPRSNTPRSTAGGATGPGWGHGWYGAGGGGMTTGTTSTIYIGQLALDMYQASAKSLVWRGTATKTLDTERQARKAAEEPRQGRGEDVEELSAEEGIVRSKRDPIRGRPDHRADAARCRGRDRSTTARRC